MILAAFCKIKKVFLLAIQINVKQTNYFTEQHEQFKIQIRKY